MELEGHLDSDRVGLSDDGKVVLARSAIGWIGGIAVAFVLGALGFALSAFAVAFAFSGRWILGVGMLILGAWTLFLTGYVWRDFQARRKWRVEIEPGELQLDLPAGRSLMEAGRRVKCFLEISDIVAIETRLEAYRSFGMINIQRNYGLRLKSGHLIILGEDRALASDLRDETMGGYVETIRLKTGLPLRDLGMVEGKGGILGAIFTSIAPWDAPGLPIARQAALWRRAAMTGWAAGAIMLTGFLLSLAL